MPLRSLIPFRGSLFTARNCDVSTISHDSEGTLNPGPTAMRERDDLRYISGQKRDKVRRRW
jgi:hypothetical protein